MKVKATTSFAGAEISMFHGEVCDVPDDIAAHIFIPFFTTKKEGSGIGLSLSRQIMRVSGGTLSLHQDKEENTTTFRIVIP